MHSGTPTGGTCTWRDRSRRLRDEALETGELFQVGGRALDAVLDALWDGLDRVDSHFREVEELDRIRRGASKEQRPRPWWKVWARHGGD